MGKREKRRKIDIHVTFEVWMEDGLAEAQDKDRLARTLIREGIEGANDAHPILEARGTAQAHKMRMHARKTHGISNTIPDKLWIARIFESEEIEQYRVQIGSQGWCGFKGTDKAVLVDREDAECERGFQGVRKSRDLGATIHGAYQSGQPDRKVLDFLRSQQIASVYVTPVRWAILHALAHRRAAGDQKHHGGHEQGFWTEFVDLVRAYIPQASTPEAQVLDAMDHGKVVGRDM